MTAQISTLGELLTNAGTQWRVYDMGRRINKIDKQQFAQIEQTQAPTPIHWVVMPFWRFNFGIIKQR